MYNVYLGDILCPVAPEKISIKYGMNVSVLNPADGGEMTFSRGERAREIEFSLLLPNSEYPFAVYRSGFQRADYFINKFREFLQSGFDFYLLIIKEKQGGKILGLDSVRCIMESMQVIDDAAQGTDVVVRVKLREHLNCLTRPLYLDGLNYRNAAVRSSESSPKPVSKSAKYRVVKGDCLWLIARRFYGDGNLYPKIYEANKNVLKGRSPRCLIFVGDELEIPPLA